MNRFIKLEGVSYEIDEDLFALLNYIAENIKSEAVAGQALYSIISAGIESGSLTANTRKVEVVKQ